MYFATIQKKIVMKIKFFKESNLVFIRAFETDNRIFFLPYIWVKRKKTLHCVCLPILPRLLLTIQLLHKSNWTSLRLTLLLLVVTKPVFLTPIYLCNVFIVVKNMICAKLLRPLVFFFFNTSYKRKNKCKKTRRWV